MTDDWNYCPDCKGLIHDQDVDTHNCKDIASSLVATDIAVARTDEGLDIYTAEGKYKGIYRQ